MEVIHIKEKKFFGHFIKIKKNTKKKTREKLECESDFPLRCHLILSLLVKAWWKNIVMARFPRGYGMSMWVTIHICYKKKLAVLYMTLANYKCPDNTLQNIGITIFYSYVKSDWKPKWINRLQVPNHDNSFTARITHGKTVLAAFEFYIWNPQ